MLSPRVLPSDGLEASEKTFQIAENTVEIKHPIHLTFEEVAQKSMQNKDTIYISKAHLEFPLIVRKWENGDYFYPLGMQGKKKISKYFKDEKISLLEKQNKWLLCDANNSIIWVVGMRKDNRYQIATAASTYFKITLQ
jgi:tRNA(Ile)-lysidine synthase